MTQAQLTQNLPATETNGPRCAFCGSENILKDAWARWDPIAARWDLDAVFDYTFCDDCGAPTEAIWPGSKCSRIKETRSQ